MQLRKAISTCLSGRRPTAAPQDLQPFRPVEDTSKGETKHGKLKGQRYSNIDIGLHLLNMFPPFMNMVPFT
jgi:hypothetical protein